MATIRNRATLDSTQFQSGLGKMQGGVKNLAGSLRAMPGLGGALSVAALAAAAQKSMEFADEIDNLSTRMGLGVETVQAYKIGLEEAGLGIGDLESATTRLERAQAEAISGNDTYAKSFRDLGIDQKRLESLNTEQLLNTVGQQMGQLSGNADAVAASYQVLGRSGGRLKQVLIDMNKDGIQTQIDEMKRLGLVYDEVMIQKLDAAQLRVERFGRQAGGVGARAFSGLIERMEFVGALAGGASMAEAYDITQEPVVNARKAKEEEQARNLKQRQQQIEANAQAELGALQEKRRLEAMSGEELRKELNAKLEIARAEMEQAQGAVERLKALEKIHDLEGRISSIKKEEVTESPDEELPNAEMQYSNLRRMGANQLGSSDRGLREQTSLIKSQVNLQKKQLQAITDIRNNMRNNGATL